MKFDGKAFGEEFAEFTKEFVARSLAPLIARLEAAERALSALPAPVDVPAVIADAIKDAVAALPAPPTAEEVAALIPTPQDGKNGADGAPGAAGSDGRSVDPATIKAMVDEAVAALPPAKNGADGKDGADGAPGRDGIDGAPGEKGMDGAPGRDGEDGLSVAGILKDHEGWLVFALADGTMQKIAHVDGKDGKDGAPGRDADPEVIRAAVQDEVQKQVMAPLATAYKGVWRDGSTYKSGSVVTWGGSLWLAKDDTADKPESTDDWTLIVKRGRDGRDGELKAPSEPKPVKLK